VLGWVSGRVLEETEQSRQEQFEEGFLEKGPLQDSKGRQRGQGQCGSRVCHRDNHGVLTGDLGGESVSGKFGVEN
jgi:hypothetical protein